MRAMYYGRINSQANVELGHVCFIDAISQTSLLTPFHILTVNDLTIAVYISSSTNQYSIFDSHSRNSIGLASDNGAAVLLQFEGMNELAD